MVTFSGFIYIDVWLSSRESGKRISPRNILVHPLSLLKSGRKPGVLANNKGGILLFDFTLRHPCMAVIDRLVLNTV